MLLWVLEFEIAGRKIYVCPDNKHSNFLRDALKFESELGAMKYLQCNNTLFKFTPRAYSFEFAD